MKLIDQIEVVLQDERSGLHINDIADRMVDMYAISRSDADKLPAKIGAALSAAVKKRGAKFSKPKNKQGRPKLGCYRLKRPSSARQPSFPDAPNVTSQHTGSAGEHAVLSELLFWGFNGSMMTVDDGIDIIASKNGSYFQIQVKTSNPTANENTFGFSIKRAKYAQKDTYSTFYILVIRKREKNRMYRDDFIILPSFTIQDMIIKGVINDGQTVSMKVCIDKGHYTLNGEDVTHIVNNFDIIHA